MKKVLTMVLSLSLFLSVYAQPVTTTKAVEVTNYKEVLSQIEYPQECKENGIEGKVIVSLEIDAQGNIESHEFISYPCSDLKEAVKKVLSKLKINAATDEEGKCIASKITMPVHFELTI